MPEGGVRSVLAINVARIGDTLLVTPAVRAIAKAHPDARILCMGHPKRAAVFEANPFVQAVRGIEKTRAHLMGWLLPRRHDLAFVWGFDQSLVAYATRVAHRVVAFRQRDAGLNGRLFRVVEPPAFQSRHSVLLHLALTDALNIPHCGHALDYCVTAQESAWAERTLAGVRARAPLVGLQIASFPTKSYRDWPVERFIELCHRIRSTYTGAHFLIFGGPAERDRTERVRDHLSNCATSFAGRLTLRETAALMRCLDLYIGIDTGPTHIAGTMKVPMVVLYHAHSPSRLIAPLEHPCLYPVDHPRVGGGPDTPMAEIDLDRVWEAVSRAMAPGVRRKRS